MMLRGTELNRLGSAALAAIISFTLVWQLAYATESSASKPIHAPKKNIRILSFKDKQRAQEVRVKAINTVKQLLDSEKDKGRRYELLRRYGELYAEQAEYALERAMLSYDQRYKAWEKTDRKQDPPKVDNTVSDKSIKMAIRIYQEIAAHYASYPGIDVTYYELGKNLLRLNDKKGVEYLKRLLKEQPNSNYRPDAYFTLGDFYFDEHDMIEARKYYNEAAKFRENSIYPYAIYKLGWTFYNFPAQTAEEEQEKFKKAVSAFKLVIKLASAMQDKDDRAIFLRQEAINDLIMVWAETEDVDSAWEYFSQINEKESFYKMLEKLGDIYVDQGKNDKAVVVFNRLIKEVPSRETNPSNHVKLFNLFSGDSKFKESVATARDMVKLYLGNGSWAVANKAKPELLKDAENTVEAALHRQATGFHKDGQKRKYPDLFKTAEQLYKVYLASFPDNPKSYELRYFLADVLFEQKSYDEAATNYVAVVRADPKKGKYSHDAALNAVIAMNQLVADMKFPAPPAAGSLAKPKTIPPEQRKLRAVLDLYTGLFPEKEASKSMMVSAAKITFDHGYYPEAIKRFEAIILKYPGTKQADECAKVTLAYFKDRKDWDEVIKYSQLFLKGKGSLGAELAQDTRKLLIFASFERALALEKNKKPLEAAEAFLKFQIDFPNEANAANAVYNAMVIYFKNGLVAEAVAAAKLVVSKYENFDKKSDVIRTIAETSESLGDFKSASQYYASFSANWPRHNLAPQSLYTAALLADAVGESRLAVGQLNRFITVYAAHPLALQARYLLADVMVKEKQVDKAIEIYTYVSENHKDNGDELAYSLARIAELKTNEKNPHGDLKDLRKLQQWLSRRSAPAAGKAREIVAAGLFSSLAPELDRYRKLLVDPNNLEQSLQAKQAALVNLANGYQRVISLQNGEYSIAATYQLGAAQEDFANAIRGVKIPKSSGSEETAKVLEKLASDLSNEAYGFYKNAYALSVRGGVLTSWSVQAYESMTRMDGGKTPKVEELTAQAGYVSHRIDYNRNVVELLR